MVRISPDGRVLQQMSIPTKGPTCVALGGVRANRLYVTSLRIRHTPEELDAIPNAGGLFAVDVPVPGQPQRLCTLRIEHTALQDEVGTA